MPRGNNLRDTRRNRYQQWLYKTAYGASKRFLVLELPLSGDLKIMSQTPLLFPRPSIGRHTASLSTSNLQPPPQYLYPPCPSPPSSQAPAPYEVMGHTKQDLSKCKSVCRAIPTRPTQLYRQAPIHCRNVCPWVEGYTHRHRGYCAYLSSQANEPLKFLIHCEYRLVSLLHYK